MESTEYIEDDDLDALLEDDETYTPDPGVDNKKNEDFLGELLPYARALSEDDSSNKDSDSDPDFAALLHRPDPAIKVKIKTKKKALKTINDAMKPRKSRSRISKSDDACSQLELYHDASFLITLD